MVSSRAVTWTMHAGTGGTGQLVTDYLLCGFGTPHRVSVSSSATEHQSLTMACHQTENDSITILPGFRSQTSHK